MSLVLTGPLATPRMLQVLGLQGTDVQLGGRLLGGARAGLDRDGWPALVPGPEPLAGVEVTPNAKLDRYAAVMGLRPQDHQGQLVMGVAPQGEGAMWAFDDAQDLLAAEIAAQVLAAPPDVCADSLAMRLPMIGIWAGSRLRAQSMEPSGGDLVARRPAGAVTMLRGRQPFAGFFAVEERQLTHALHEGGESRPMIREGFMMGDAVVVLPWDPVRDRVTVIEQFRFAPALRGDPQPWLLEPVAGRVDAGETVEEAARREALEEADLRLDRLVPCFHAYPSPGAVCEFLYQFIGIADLPDGCAGIHGLEGEAEDIRGHLLPRARLSAMVDAGEITNGPLATLSLWLDARADRLRAELAGA
ncbi:NUDIX domain-containing protein [Paracoccus sp. T5]|uniref:NUDIX domain-containing protein n=1 Tax=Paracoccus sp. T5 TaxID=3402161 RepID=UPI003ADE8069